MLLKFVLVIKYERGRHMDRQFWVLYFNIFLVFLAIGLIIPVMPVFLTDLNLTGSDLGLMVAVFALAQMIISPFGGNLADKIGKKIIIVVGLGFFTISEVMFAVGYEFSTLMISRVMGGISAALIMPGVTGLIGDLSKPSEKAKNFGYMAAVISLGFILGPGVGGALAASSHRLPFFVAAGLGVLAIICSILFIKERKKSTTVTHTHIDTAAMKKIDMKVFITPVILTFILAFGLSAFETLFSLYTAYKVDYKPLDISIAITGGGIFGAIFQLFFFDKFMKYMKELPFIVYSLIYSAIVLFILTLVNSYWSVMVISFIVFIGFDLIRPALTNYFSNIAGDRQGFAGGLNSTFTSMGNFVAPLAAGTLFDVNVEFPLYLSIVVMLVGVGVIFIEQQLQKRIAAKS